MKGGINYIITTSSSISVISFRGESMLSKVGIRSSQRYSFGSTMNRAIECKDIPQRKYLKQNGICPNASTQYRNHIGTEKQMKNKRAFSQM
jgi:hypothetical protein